MGYIYKITCSANGKNYIGSTEQLPEERHKQHWKDLRGGYARNPIMQAAWEKYGEEAFEFEVVATVPGEVLLEEEDRFMEAFSSMAPVGFNCQGASRTFMTEEVRAKMSASKMGELNPFWGKKHDEETRKKMSEFQRGRVLTEEHKAKIGAANKGELNSFWGKTHDEETRKKMSEKQKQLAMALSPEERKQRTKAMADAVRGKKKSDEVRARMSAGAKRRWEKYREEKERARSEDRALEGREAE